MRTSEFTLDMGKYGLTCRLVSPEAAELASQPGLVINLAGDRRTTLGSPNYNDPSEEFVRAGHRALSFDLPGHGERIDEHGEGIAGWRAALLAGRDPFERVVVDGVAAIDACLERGTASEGRIFVSGVSRGGYCALRLAAQDRRISGVAGIAPVTDWRVLSEFASVKDLPEVASLALDNWAAALAERPVFLTVGNHDHRVGTHACVRFAQRLVEHEDPAAERLSQVQLQVVDAPGHAIGKEWRVRGALYLLELCKAVV